MSNQEPTSLHLPPDLPYPITIRRFLVEPDIQVDRGTPILGFNFWPNPPIPVKPGDPPQPDYRVWDSPSKGVLQRWLMRRTDGEITKAYAQTNPVAVLLEPCTHGAVFHGLCAFCGEDVTVPDYMTVQTAAQKASIRMTHDINGPTVSAAQAAKYDQDTAVRLLAERKLSLIVDLDQTIVHATVDPTVGEWMNEAEAWREKRQVTMSLDNGETSSEKLEEEEQAENPNWPALSDVSKFDLGEDNTRYYIKPRPGLLSFLSRMKTLYEMHVYTMGTRAYALEVCKAIDPDGTIFNERVLTRDESGSLTTKNLERLFPSDQSMVVIIDDRSDVWSDVPNLVKVIPYEFFVGIGDINSAHLPALPNQSTSAPTSLAELAVSNSSSSPSPPSSTSPSPLFTPPVPTTSTVSSSSPVTPPPPTSPPTPLMTTVDLDASTSTTPAKIIEEAQHKAIEAVVESRPLARIQRELDNQDDPVQAEKETEEGHENEENGDNSVEGKDGKADVPPTKVKHRMILHNDDYELGRLDAILSEVHRRYFQKYDVAAAGLNSGTTSNTRDRRLRAAKASADVRRVISDVKAQTLRYTQITFSNVFPTNINPTLQPIWQQALRFGAICHPTWTEEVTHVVAAKLGSEKTHRGEHKRGVHVVHPKWLLDSVARWQRQDEEPYAEMLRVEAHAEAGAASDNVKLGDERSTTPPGEPDPGSKPHSKASPMMLDDDEVAAAEDEARLGAREVDWAAADEEVDAFLNETDDDDDAVSDASGRSKPPSVNASPFKPSPLNPNPHKRARSRTPGDENASNRSTSSMPRTPLVKKQRLEPPDAQQAIPGPSTLRQSFSKTASTTSSSSSSSSSEDSEMPPWPRLEAGDGRATSVARSERQEEEDNSEDDEGDYEMGNEEEEEDDFLARELEEG